MSLIDGVYWQNIYDADKRKERPEKGIVDGGIMMINTVTVRWHDGYLEEFEATEVRFGSDLLWLRLKDGKNRHIPLRSVRWFGLSKESHQTEPPKEKV